MDEYIHLSTMFTSGSYGGWTALETARYDPEYIRWLDRETKFLVGEDVIVEAQIALERMARGHCKECDDD